MDDDVCVEISSDEGDSEPSVVFFGGREVQNTQAREIGPIDLRGSTAASPIGNWATFSILNNSVVVNEEDTTISDANSHRMPSFSPIAASPDLPSRQFGGEFPRMGGSGGGKQTT